MFWGSPTFRVSTSAALNPPNSYVEHEFSKINKNRTLARSLQAYFLSAVDHPPPVKLILRVFSI